MFESVIDKLGNELIPVIAIVGGLSFASFWVICATIVSLYRNWLNARIKTTLIQRGASAEEITRIVEAGDGGAAQHNNIHQSTQQAMTQTFAGRQPSKPVKRLVH